MKRFSETDKWKDKWFRQLCPESKLLWVYLCDSCDNAGFIEIDFDLWKFQTGVSDVEGAYKGLVRGLLAANGYIWIRNFIKHQKNLPLNPINNAHKQIINLINLQAGNFGNQFPEIEKVLGACKGLLSPIGKGKGKGKGKEEGIVKGGTTEPEIEDGSQDTFEDFWVSYERKGNKKAARGFWEKLSEADRKSAIEALGAYFGEQPEMRYRKDAERYLRDRVFESVLERAQFGVVPEIDPEIAKESMRVYGVDISKMQFAPRGV